MHIKPVTAPWWIGVDLDGTLAHYKDWNGGAIGDPVPAMRERVKLHLESGNNLKIFTARVAGSGLTNPQGDTDSPGYADAQRRLIEAWCLQHLGQTLPVTAVKDLYCVEIWDDRAMQIITNQGVSLGESMAHEVQKLRFAFDLAHASVIAKILQAVQTCEDPWHAHIKGNPLAAILTSPGQCAEVQKALIIAAIESLTGEV